MVECEQATEAPISHWLMSPLSPLSLPPSLLLHPFNPPTHVPPAVCSSTLPALFPFLPSFLPPSPCLYALRWRSSRSRPSFSSFVAKAAPSFLPHHSSKFHYFNPKVLMLSACSPPLSPSLLRSPVPPLSVSHGLSSGSVPNRGWRLCLCA